jgi:hypothetical protein
VQAQTNTAEDMDSMNVIMTEKMTKTITCNMTGNAALIGNAEIAGKLENMTGNMENMTGNMSGTPKTVTVTGKMAIIKNLDNLPGKVVMIGKMDNLPGKVVMIGKMNNMPMAEDMNMPGMAGNIGNVTILMFGNMTATMTLDMTGNMDNMSGNMANMTGNMTGMPENMDNMAVLMAGNMTGTVTGDMTRKMVVIKNTGNMAEMIGKICNMYGMAGNMTGNMTENMTNMGNMTGPMTCDMTGAMLIFRDIDRMTGMAESMDMIEMGGDMAILGKMRDTTGMDGKMNNMIGIDGKMDNMIGMDGKMDKMDNMIEKLVIIKKTDDTTQILTKTVTGNITGKTIQVKSMSMTGMGEKIGNLTGIGEKIGNLAENMTNNS